MYDFCFMLKTYNRDIRFVERLVKTYINHNVDGIHLYIVVPQKDIQLFIDYENEFISVIAEETINVSYFKEGYNGLSAGYLNQEICKLAFWKLNLCKNYCCLDSECYFIRDFVKKDFMYNEYYPYSVLIEDKDLQIDYQYYKYFWKNRQIFLDKIAKCIGLEEQKYLTCHGFQNMSTEVLEDFEKKFMLENGYTYVDIISIAPYEFSWYNFWLMKTKVIPIHMCEPFFKTYHTKKQYWRDIFFGITLRDLSRAYIGIIINGNFTAKEEILHYGEFSFKENFQDQDRMKVKHISLLMKLLLWQPLLFWRGIKRTIRVKIKKGNS